MCATNLHIAHTVVIIVTNDMVAILKGLKKRVKNPEKNEPLFFCIFDYMKMHNQQKNQFWQKNLAESVFFYICTFTIGAEWPHYIS